MDCSDSHYCECPIVNNTHRSTLSPCTHHAAQKSQPWKKMDEQVTYRRVIFGDDDRFQQDFAVEKP
jgi:hypothetical protein